MDGCPPLVPSPAGFGVGFPRTRLGWVGWVGRVGGWVASLTLLHLLGKDVKPEVPSPAGFGVGDVNFRLDEDIAIFWQNDSSEKSFALLGLREAGFWTSMSILRAIV